MIRCRPRCPRLEVHSHLTSTFAIFFELCRPVLENGNVKCKDYYTLPWIDPILGVERKTVVMCAMFKARSH